MVRENQKHCYICKKYKDLSMFYKDSRNRFGRASDCKECFKKRDKKRKRNRAEYLRNYAKDYSKLNENQKKILARRMAVKAIKDGVLFKGKCLFCFKNKTNAHHPDYDKPLDVVWLCDSSHQKVHHSILPLNTH